MLKDIIPLILILLVVSASNGQTAPTAQDYLKSGMAHFLLNKLSKGERNYATTT